MNELLPAYAAGSLPAADRARVDAHLLGCPRCRADLSTWQALAAAAPPVPGAAPRAPEAGRMVREVLARSTLEEPVGRPRGGTPTRRLRHLAGLLGAEARLIRLAVPIASALVMAVGVAVVLVQADLGGPERIADVALALIAPIVAAAGVSGTYRSARDPVAELVAATPTSERLLLLVRLALVVGYDLVLALAASAVLTVSGAAGTADLNTLVSAWLGPMMLLTALSLLVAVRFGPDVALGVAAGLWAVRVLAVSVLTADAWPARVIVPAWSTNAPVLALSAALAIAAVLLAGRSEPHRDHRATHPL
ncbi:zf-HC2 domain-containing protein [Cryptosporangium japonicum]|uniref:Putative zinc-finger domain-containing protein n=1 Tax=Cryptosporangium japonicum TaxID=80872 RepID=A0ABP3EI39_9ACTN